MLIILLDFKGQKENPYVQIILVCSIYIAGDLIYIRHPASLLMKGKDSYSPCPGDSTHKTLSYLPSKAYNL